MNRRSFLSFLGLAPIAAPAAAAAVSTPVLPAVDYAGLAKEVQIRINDAVHIIDMRADGSSRVVVDAGRFHLRANADCALSKRIDAVIQQADAQVASLP